MPNNSFSQMTCLHPIVVASCSQSQEFPLSQNVLKQIMKEHFFGVFLSVKWSLRNLKVQAPNLTQALIFLQIYFQPTTMSPTYILVESWELGRQ